jgi:hypothetical protein
MLGSRPCVTLMQWGLQPSKIDGTLLNDPHLYRMVVGALQYVTITRPDITFVVNKASQFIAHPTDAHWQLMKCILRYLHGTLYHGLHLKASPHLNLNAYNDTNWTGCPDDRRSTISYEIYLGSNIVSWSSKKQATVSRSSMEAEYQSLAMTTSELLWLTSLLSIL